MFNKSISYEGIFSTNKSLNVNLFSFGTISGSNLQKLWTKWIPRKQPIHSHLEKFSYIRSFSIASFASLFAKIICTATFNKSISYEGVFIKIKVCYVKLFSFGTISRSNLQKFWTKWKLRKQSIHSYLEKLSCIRSCSIASFASFFGITASCPFTFMHWLTNPDSFPPWRWIKKRPSTICNNYMYRYFCK